MKKIAKPVLTLLATTMLAGTFLGAWHGAGTELGAVGGAKERIMDVIEVAQGAVSYEISPHILPTDYHPETGALMAQVPDGHYITRTINNSYAEKTQHQLIVNRNGVAISAASVHYNEYGEVTGYSTGDVDQMFRGAQNSPELLAQRVKGFVAMANKATGQSIEVTGIRTYDGQQNHIIDISGVEVSEDVFMQITQTAEYQGPVSRFLSEKAGFEGLSTGKVTTYTPPQIQNHWLENARDMLSGGSSDFHTLAADKTTEVSYRVEQATNADGVAITRFVERYENPLESDSSLMKSAERFTEYALEIPINGTATDAVLTITRGTETITPLGTSVEITETLSSAEDPGILLRLPTAKEAAQLHHEIRQAKSNIETLARRGEIESQAQAYDVALAQFRTDYAEQLGAMRVKPSDLNADTMGNIAWRVRTHEENQLRDYESLYRSTVNDIKANRDRLPLEEVQGQLDRFKAEYEAYRGARYDVISGAMDYATGGPHHALRYSHQLVAEGRLDEMQEQVDALLAKYGSVENAEAHLQQATLQGVGDYASEIATAIRDKELPPTRETLPVLQPVSSNSQFKMPGPMV